MITEITTLEELQEITKDGICLVDFWAKWCGPCRMLGSVLEEISNENIFSIVKVNVDEAQNLASEFNIQSIPHVILFKNGILTDQKTGFLSKSTIIKWIEETK